MLGMYDYNNTVPLLNIAKIQIIRYIILNLALCNISSASQPVSLPASQLAIRRDSTNAKAPDFHTRKVIVSSL